VPAIEADTIRLELALLNLITNSLDAMPSGGTLTISVSSEGPRAQIEIADTGTGIAPELLPGIFAPWITTKPAGRGSGLGLSIAKEVIAARGGSIAAWSELGKGAVFTIQLPVAVPEPSRVT
jgi:two-component system sensor histidine kinase BaeS